MSFYDQIGIMRKDLPIRKEVTTKKKVELTTFSKRILLEKNSFCSNFVSHSNEAADYTHFSDRDAEHPCPGGRGDQV